MEYIIDENFGAFSRIMMSSFLSVKLYGCLQVVSRYLTKVLLLCFIVLAVTSVNECLYKLDPLFALLTLNNLFQGLVALFWSLIFYSFQKALLLRWENLI